MPDEATRKQAIDQFQQELKDVLDWNSAHYVEGEAILHT